MKSKSDAVAVGVQGGDIVTEIPLENIVLGQRFRQNYGDTKGLADSIAETGLQHPITVVASTATTGKYLLVAGGRRYMAYRDHLKREAIPAIIKTLINPKAAEIEENNQRKPFTPREMLAIAEAVIADVGERRGAPPKNGGVDIPNQTYPIRKGEKTRDYAIRVSGLGSHGTYENVKAVYSDQTIEAVQNALDEAAISINCAYELSLQPAKKQLTLLDGIRSGDAVNKKKLRKQAEERREEKRLTKAGINPKKTNNPKAPANDEDCHGVVYASPNFYNSKVETLAAFPIHSHILNESLVMIEALSIHAHKAYELAAAWNLVPKDVLAFYPPRTKKKPGGYTDTESKVVVICGYDEEPSVSFSKVRLPFVHNVEDIVMGPRETIARHFQYQGCTLLDATLSEKEAHGRWMSCRARYGYCIE
ncbi:MAG: ParB N-terminal domain-containing protein [Chitinispirillia bacterium]|nr:ParB N-terminal domain-containing protein [Chitinispirillia bacterium]MCL2268577.1 ParB N-terminal domain-containing protein [Chitinispirillia bacterium]